MQHKHSTTCKRTPVQVECPMPPIQNHQHTHGRETLKLRDNPKQRRRRLLSADRKSRLREELRMSLRRTRRGLHGIFRKNQSPLHTHTTGAISHSIKVNFALRYQSPSRDRYQQYVGLSNASVFPCAGCLRASIISNGHSFENILMFAFPVLSTQRRYTVSGKYSRMGSTQKNLLL